MRQSQSKSDFPQNLHFWNQMEREKKGISKILELCSFFPLKTKQEKTYLIS